MKKELTLPTKPFQRQRPAATIFPLDQLAVPAVIFEAGRMIRANASFDDLLPLNAPARQTLNHHPKIEQITQEMSVVQNGLTFDLFLDDRTFHCMASPLSVRHQQSLILFEDISMRAQGEKNTALLYRLSLLLSAPEQSVEAKLQAAIDHILFEFPSYDCSIYAWDRQAEHLYQVAWGTTDINSSRVIGRQTLKLGQGIIGYVGQQLKPMVIPDILADRRFIRRPEDEQHLAMLAVPLVMHGELFGVLTITRLPGQTFDDQEVQLFMAIANRLALLIENNQVTEAILNEKNKLDQILTTLPDGVILYTADMKIALYNQMAKRLLGLKKDITGLAWERVLDRDMEKYCTYRLIRHFDPREFLHQAIQEGRISTGLATLTSQPPKTIEITVAPVYDRTGQISGALSHFRDISPIHELQTKMATRVQQLTHLFKISSVTGYNTFQIVRRILRLVLQLLTVKSCQLLLYDESSQELNAIETVGNQSLLPKLEPKLSKKVAWVVRHRQPQLFRAKIDKTHIPVLITPIIGRHPTASGVLVVADHESKRHYFSREDLNLLSIVATQIAAKLDNAHLLNQIEADRNKLAAIIEQSVDGILVLDDQQVVRIWNSALEQLTGIEEAEIIDQPIDEAYQMVEILEKIKSENLTEIRIRHRQTGKPIWLGIAHAPITHGRTTTGYVGVVRDISRQKELERSKNEFISTASHELRSPITAIVGYLSMLKRGDAGQLVDKQQAFFVDKAYQNAKRMVDLVEDLLMTTRMETGQVRYQIEALSIADLLDSILSDVRFRAEEKQLKLSLNRKESAEVLTDRDATHRVFSNIITNAIKYTPNGGRITINFTQGQEKGRKMLVTHIHDTGVGIDPADQEKVFEKFTRLDNPLSVSAGGTGLGLYITRTIIEELGGRIWLESEKGKGSTFYISLPLATALR